MKRGLPLLSLEFGLYGLIFIAAAVLRLYHLGAAPLNDLEASQASLAYSIARSNPVLTGAQPAYVFFTSGLFFLFGSSDFLARFFPAIFGSLVVFLPWLFREKIDRLTALLLALLLAFDPGLAALSRHADGGMLALVFTLAAAGLLVKKAASGAGVFAALSILSGPMVWPGWIGLGVAGAASISSLRQEESDLSGNQGSTTLDWRRFGLFFLGTFLAAGTLFTLVPQGLASSLDQLLIYFVGWGRPSVVSAGHLLAALLVYQPVALIFGLTGVVHAFLLRNVLDQALARWLAIALLLALIYPSHQATDLCWPLIPLWGLAARQIIRAARFPWDNRLVLIGQAVFVFTLTVFAVLSAVSLLRPERGNQDSTLEIVAMISSIALLILLTYLVSSGWSWLTARTGLLLGFGAILVFYSLSSAWNGAGLGSHPEAEMWSVDSTSAEMPLLVQTVNSISEWNHGIDNGADVIVSGFRSPALNWYLRRTLSLTYMDQLPANANPSILFTPIQKTPSLAASYRGQDFGITATPSWSLMAPMEWLRWFVFREPPMEKGSIVLWARNELFPVGAAPAAKKSP